MEVMYYSKTTGGFYSSLLHEPEQIPKEAVEITKQQHEFLLGEQSLGKTISADSNGFPVLVEEAIDYSAVERAWRDSELDRADEELNKVQDSDPKAYGTVTQWRDYRKELRAWPEHAQFPTQAQRPKSPDFKE